MDQTLRFPILSSKNAIKAIEKGLITHKIKETLISNPNKRPILNINLSNPSFHTLQAI